MMPKRKGSLAFDKAPVRSPSPSSASPLHLRHQVTIFHARMHCGTSNLSRPPLAPVNWVTALSPHPSSVSEPHCYLLQYHVRRLHISSPHLHGRVRYTTWGLDTRWTTFRPSTTENASSILWLDAVELVKLPDAYMQTYVVWSPQHQEWEMIEQEFGGHTSWNAWWSWKKFTLFLDDELLTPWR